MIKRIKIILLCIATGFLTSCSQVLQSVDLEISTQDNSEQETFSVIEKTLTIQEARKQKSAPYDRSLLKNGRGEGSKPIPESNVLASNFPKNKTSGAYRLGIGDTVTFSRLFEKNYHPITWKLNGQNKQVVPIIS